MFVAKYFGAKLAWMIPALVSIGQMVLQLFSSIEYLAAFVAHQFLLCRYFFYHAHVLRKNME
jgi:hypothetical protein